MKLLQQGEWTKPATYCGLDVSDRSTHLCVVDADGKVIWRGVCATDPAALAATLAKRAPDFVRVVLETGPLSAWKSVVLGAKRKFAGSFSQLIVDLSEISDTGAPVLPAARISINDSFKRAFAQAMSSHVLTRANSGSQAFLASRNEMPVVLFGPQAAY